MRLELLLICTFFVANAAVYSQEDLIQKFGGINDQQSVLHTRIPARIGTQTPLVDERLAPFYHGVASGDPLHDRVIIWTRVTMPNSEPVSVEWFVATDTAMMNIVRRGTVSTNVEKDYTCKVDVEGLIPATTYYYMFKYNGKNSLVGRTKTTPDNTTEHLRFAFVSCSNYTSGYFNAYRKIGVRNDLDAVIHLGDYIYEYGNTSNNSSSNVRDYPEDIETITLADYRARYAIHRLDEDLRRLHQQHPFIYVWDDHEAANNAYKSGAQNHNPAKEGEWTVRLSASKKACFEWMPIRENSGDLYRKFTYGNLADVIMLDTRMDERDIPVVNLGDNASQSSKDSLNNPDRKIISEKQMNWLTQNLSDTKTKWKIIGNQVLFTPVSLKNFDTIAFIDKPELIAITPILRATLESGYNADSWGNFPSQRNKLHSFIKDNSIKNVVFLTGDIHTTNAIDVAFEPEKYNPNTKTGSVAVEFVTPSITSANLDEIIGSVAFLVPYKDILLKAGVNTMRNNNPHMKKFDVTRHGYSILDIKPERTQADVFHVDTVTTVTDNERVFSSSYVNNDDSYLTEAQTISAEKILKDIPAPLLPLQTIVHVRENPIVVNSVYPVPAQHKVYFTLIINKSDKVLIELYNTLGEKMLSGHQYDAQMGIDVVGLSVTDLPPGSYIAKIKHGSTTISHSIIIQR